MQCTQCYRKVEIGDGSFEVEYQMNCMIVTVYYENGQVNNSNRDYVMYHPSVLGRC